MSNLKKLELRFTDEPILANVNSHLPCHLQSEVFGHIFMFDARPALILR